MFSGVCRSMWHSLKHNLNDVRYKVGIILLEMLVKIATFEVNFFLTPTNVTKLQTAHFTDGAPYWYTNSIRQFPQFTYATWFAKTTEKLVIYNFFTILTNLHLNFLCESCNNASHEIDKTFHIRFDAIMLSFTLF